MGVASVIRDYVEEMPATFGQDLDSQQQKVGAFVNFGKGCTLCTAQKERKNMVFYQTPQTPLCRPPTPGLIKDHTSSLVL